MFSIHETLSTINPIATILGLKLRLCCKILPVNFPSYGTVLGVIELDVLHLAKKSRRKA